MEKTTLYKVKDIRNNRYYSVAVIHPNNAKYFVTYEG